MFERPGKAPPVEFKQSGKATVAETIEITVLLLISGSQQVDTHHGCHGKRDKH